MAEVSDSQKGTNVAMSKLVAADTLASKLVAADTLAPGCGGSGGEKVDDGCPIISSFELVRGASA